MKPAGVERDREIAEMRGDELRKHTERFYVRDNSAKGYREEIVDIESPKPYSTDISAAMELWEEMKGERYRRIEIVRTEDERILCIMHDRAPDGFLYHRGKTEADAISGAWLKWKGEGQ